MTDPDWKPNACSICYVNCAIEVQTDGRDITRIRGDKKNPRSRGYLCQKAQGLKWYARPKDRLTTPLKRQPDGSHKPVDWDTALTEIAEKLQTVRNADLEAGRKGAFAYYGGGGQGNHSGGAFGLSLMAWMNSDRYFSAISQEVTGDFWVNGHMFGSHNCHVAEGVDDCDLLVMIGSNPWMAHGFARARDHLRQISKDPNRKMIAIDPRRSESAAMSDLHLPVKPGRDAYLLSALIARIIDRNGVDQNWVQAHCDGLAPVVDTLTAIPVEQWTGHAGISMELLDQTVDMILSARAMTVQVELGIQQAWNSTLNSYLEKLLYLLTGHFGRAGTNGLHSWLMPMWGNSRNKRSDVTGAEYIGALLPTNLLGREVSSDHPDRARVLWIESGNPANSAADTAGMVEAFQAADLSVVVDVAYTESARLADYVLPAASQHEKWEYTLFTYDWPQNFFHIRRPLFEPLAGTMPEAEIYRHLMEKLSAMPSAEMLDQLTDLARSDRIAFVQSFQGLLADEPEFRKVAALILYCTLGQTLPDGAANIAPLWQACHMAVRNNLAATQRALDADLTGHALAETLFDRLIDSPHGMVFSHHEYGDIWQMMRHDRIQLAIPEMLEWIARLDPADDRSDDYPFILIAGQRRSHNGNQLIRTAAWRKTDPDGALRITPSDLSDMGAEDGDWLVVSSPTGRLVVRAAVDDTMHPGQVALPHGMGFQHGDGFTGPAARTVDGPRLNLLTDTDYCDPISHTPWHKNVRVKLVPASPDESLAAIRQRDAVQALARAG